MIVAEHRGIELDYCVDCRGIWFDKGELDLLIESLGPALGDTAAALALKDPEAPPGEKPRRCPLCRKKMEKKLIGKTPAVLIDNCPNGQGLWFDGGELGSLVKGLAKESLEGEEKVLSFLGGFLKGPEE
jgi:Zn-finger nucleic acid-binding protein